MSLFTCKVRYDKMMENGVQKTTTEQYVVNALSFTEAEANIIEKITPFISGDFIVADISRLNVTEVMQANEGDKWYKVKVNFITIDEKSEMEKKTTAYMHVKGDGINQAKENQIAEMKGTL